MSEKPTVSKKEYKPVYLCYKCKKPLKLDKEGIPETWFCDDSCKDAYWKERESKRASNKFNRFKRG